MRRRSSTWTGSEDLRKLASHPPFYLTKGDHFGNEGKSESHRVIWYQVTEKSKKESRARKRLNRKGNRPHHTNMRQTGKGNRTDNLPNEKCKENENSPITSDQRNYIENWTPYFSIRLVKVRAKDSAQCW